MSRLERAELTPAVTDFLDGTDLKRKVGETILLVTVGESGWPHLAMLSVGEMLAISDTRLRVALWPGTNSGNNLVRTGRATFVLVLAGAGIYIEADVTLEPQLEFEDGPLDSFLCSVTRVLVDEVDYAALTSGITFELPDEESAVARWGRTVAAMRQS